MCYKYQYYRISVLYKHQSMHTNINIHTTYKYHCHTIHRISGRVQYTEYRTLKYKRCASKYQVLLCVLTSTKYQCTEYKVYEYNILMGLRTPKYKAKYQCFRKNNSLSTRYTKTKYKAKYKAVRTYKMKITANISRRKYKYLISSQISSMAKSQNIRKEVLHEKISPDRINISCTI